jgi:hypothetical protein
MSVFKSVCVSMLVSLVCGALVFFLSYGPQGRPKPALVFPGGVPGEGFAELILDASHPDRQIRDILAREGINTTIGESSQWVFLDDFGKLERIPLDRYWDRVEPFDPRNDGYAEELQSFFVHKGERRIFIGLKGAPLNLEGRIRAALGDIRYSLTALTPRRSPLAPALLFIAAAALTLLLSREIPVALFFLPLWAPLAGFGAAGFALMSVLAGFEQVLREPAREYFVSRRYGTAGGKAHRSLGLWVLSGLFLAAAALLAVFGRLPPLTVPAALICVPLILYVSLRTESCRGVTAGHIRFKPVQITPLAGRPGAYSPSMVPFAVAALALQFLPMILPGAAAGSLGGPSREWSGWKSSPELNEERYRTHLAFQQAFSYTSLGAGESSYLRYSLAGDGLIDGNGSAEAVFAEPEAIPPFSLASLIDFLDNYAYTNTSPVSPQGGACPLILLGLWIPLILRDRRGRRMWGKLSPNMDKRIAA